MLNHTIGRDVSKYFYGGYSLDGNIGLEKPRRGIVHSNEARRIVNDLIIAYYEPEVEKTSTVCRLNQDKFFAVNNHVRTIYLESVSKQAIPNFKRHYQGFEVLTKHFWIRCL